MSLATFLGISRDKPKVWTTEHLKKLDELGAAKYVFGFDVSTQFEAGDQYTLHHHCGMLGWEVQILGKKTNAFYGEIEKILIDLMGGIEKVNVEKKEEGTLIRPNRKTSLSEVAGYVDHYETKGIKPVHITDVSTSRTFPGDLYKKAKAEGVPLK